MLKKSLAIAAAVLAICSCSRTTTVDKTISLAGEWRFAMDLDTDAANRPAARCLRQSLLDYASGDQFNPDHSLDPKMLETVLR